MKIKTESVIYQIVCYFLYCRFWAPKRPFNLAFCPQDGRISGSIFLFYSLHFKTSKSFNRFVSQFLSLRNDKTALHTLNIHHEGTDDEPRQLKRIIKYAFLHGLKHVFSTCYLGHHPLCYFSCHTLTSLNLCANNNIIISNFFEFACINQLVSKILWLLW